MAHNPATKAMVLVGVLLASASSFSAAAEPTSYCADPLRQDQQQRLGWSFYCDPKKARPKPKPDVEQQPAAPAPAPDDPLERVAHLRQELERAKAEAILDPTNPDKVATYIVTQRERLERAGAFADTWRRVLWSRPDLDYTLERPVGSIAKNTWLDARREAEKGAAADLAQRYGVFFIYSSTCPYCRSFSPILRQWADANQVTVMAVSVDGGFLPEWPESVVDTGQVQRLGLAGKPVPATVLFDTKDNTVSPIAFGAVSAGDLSERVLALTKMEVGGDF